MIGTTQAAKLLKICTQRVRRLLKEGRIKGARKDGRFWQIPLFNGKPKVTKGRRGPKPNWRKRTSKALTRICVNQHYIRSNRKHGTNNPVVRVESGKSVRYYHDVEIAGNCRVVYRPNNPLSCGAQLWIEVAEGVMVTSFQGT
ncbi:MAG: helix-turn-helix domain-containing protein [Rivularia sp. (in: cyanobacteria)]